MSKLSKRVDELERIIRLLYKRSEIELYAGDEIVESIFCGDYHFHDVPRMINVRQATVKDVLLELLNRLEIDLVDIPPEKPKFKLAFTDVEEDDD